MKRLFSLILVTFFLILPLSSCKKTDNVAEKFSDTKELIGTFVSITAYGENAEIAVISAFERAFELEKIFSLTINNSEINRVNEKAFESSVIVSEELFSAVRVGLYYSELSENALDISAGKLIDLWGIGTDSARVPDKAEIAPLIGVSGYENIQLDHENKTIIFKSEDTKLNLGAIGKGFIADELKKVLIEKGVVSALINLGGNVLAVGTKLGGDRWRVGIADPSAPDSLIGSVSVDGMSVVTSGDYEKYFENNGVKYHHILNTGTGFPSDSDLSSATIVGASSAGCDALSTAVFVLGSEKAIILLEKLEGYEGVLIRKSGEIVTTSGIDEFSFKGD